MKANDDNNTDRPPGEENYWYSVLSYFEHRGYVHNGLTIPFLIGAGAFYNPEQPLMSVEELIDEFSEVGCTILRCQNIGEFVIGTLDTETTAMKHLYKTIGDKIIAIDDSLNHIETLQEFITEMKARYAGPIESSNFSKNYGNWSYFSDVECQRLNEWIGNS